MSKDESDRVAVRWDKRPIVVQLVDVMASHFFAESSGPSTLVQVVDVLAGHGSRLFVRVLDRLVPVVDLKQSREPVDWEKLVLVTPTPKRLETLALVLRGAIMMNRRQLDSDQAWEVLGFKERAPWIHIAATLWSTTFRIALEAYQRQQTGKEDPRAENIEATASGASDGAQR